jgi:hypothetical protein
MPKYKLTIESFEMKSYNLWRKISNVLLDNPFGVLWPLTFWNSCGIEK